jgi:hypothetical protein
VTQRRLLRVEGHHLVGEHLLAGVGPGVVPVPGAGLRLRHLTDQWKDAADELVPVLRVEPLDDLAGPVVEW